MLNSVEKVREAYNKIAAAFSGTRYDTWPELEQFKPFIKDGQYILDWGCGNGRLLLMTQGKKIHYVGVDTSEELLKIARQKHALAITSGQADFFWIAEQDKDFGQNYFDLVFMVASFHHLPDEARRLAVLKKIHYELKPGGKIIMLNWNLESDWAIKEQQKKIASSELTNWEKLGDNDYIIPWKDNKGVVVARRYYHHFAKAELTGLLERSGFVIERQEFSDSTNWTDEKGGKNLVTVASVDK